MRDYESIAQKYANECGYDIVIHSAERRGYRYFHLDFTNRPRYTGHPYIIKINPARKVIPVYNVDEIYWAVKQSTGSEKQP